MILVSSFSSRSMLKLDLCSDLSSTCINHKAQHLQHVFFSKALPLYTSPSTKKNVAQNPKKRSAPENSTKQNNVLFRCASWFLLGDTAQTKLVVPTQLLLSAPRDPRGHLGQHVQLQAQGSSDHDDFSNHRSGTWRWSDNTSTAAAGSRKVFLGESKMIQHVRFFGWFGFHCDVFVWVSPWFRYLVHWDLVRMIHKQIHRSKMTHLTGPSSLWTHEKQHRCWAGMKHPEIFGLRDNPALLALHVTPDAYGLIFWDFSGISRYDPEAILF